jgi:hypothetical protein
MAVRLYMDVHVPLAITEQLRSRGVDVLRAAEDGADELEDDKLLERAGVLGRLLFTQDIRFEVLARQWQNATRQYDGILVAAVSAADASFPIDSGHHVALDFAKP